MLGGATYYPLCPSAGWSYDNGRPLQRVLDQDYRPQAIQDSRSDGLNVGFVFDPVGNLTALTAPGNTAPVVSLGYDTLSRLTAFKDGPTGTVIDGYSYDATGNRLSAQVNGSTQTYSYPTDSHRLASVAGASRSYDATGNTTAIGGTAREFAYDATGRMSQAKRGGTLAMEYRYNDRGEQVRRFLGTTNTYTVYDEAGHWLGDYDSNGKALQQAIWLDDLPVGVLAGSALNYVQPDHLGTPRTVIDPVRDVAIWKWDIKGEAFGNSPPDQDADRDGTAFVFGMRFPGQRYDGATGLNQNYFRDYDTSSGRYGQSDPVGLGGGLNTYAYSESSPLSNSDPYGLTIVVPPWWSISSPKPALTPRPITAPLDPAIPVPGTSPNDPSGEYCKSLARRIENTKKEIYEKRYPDLGKDPNPLPWRIGPGEKLKETIRGHEKLLNRRLRELRQLEDEYDQKCRIVACT